MLMASSNRIVGDMNSQARPLSLMPRTLRANGSGVARATLSAVRLSMVSPASVTWVRLDNGIYLNRVPCQGRHGTLGSGSGGAGYILPPLHLAIVLEHPG